MSQRIEPFRINASGPIRITDGNQLYERVMWARAAVRSSSVRVGCVFHAAQNRLLTHLVVTHCTLELALASQSRTRPHNLQTCSKFSLFATISSH
jgi:hypothetical protein